VCAAPSRRGVMGPPRELLAIDHSTGAGVSRSAPSRRLGSHRRSSRAALQRQPVGAHAQVTGPRPIRAATLDRYTARYENFVLVVPYSGPRRATGAPAGAERGVGAPVPLDRLFLREKGMRAVVTVETVLWFPRSLWTRSWRPQLRQFPQPAADMGCVACGIHELGGLTGSALGALRSSATRGCAPR
jgi:hypothetical protein